MSQHHPTGHLGIDFALAPLQQQEQHHEGHRFNMTALGCNICSIRTAPLPGQRCHCHNVSRRTA